jgi:hypothetical protein
MVDFTLLPSPPYVAGIQDYNYFTMNRLSTVTSPYLLQHADNPVDWYPWGEEALAKF